MIDSHTLQRLQAIGLAPHLEARLQAEPPPTDAPFLLRVTEVQRDALVLHDGDHHHAARVRPALLRELDDAGDGLAVGDWVFASCNVHREWWVHRRVCPYTQLARRLHDGRDKITRTVIVANVDAALLVMGLDDDYNLRRLERYLALVRGAGIDAVVVLNKADLCPNVVERMWAVRTLLPPGVGLRAVNALDDDVAEALEPWLGPRRTLVMLGSSGAGKSTLANALIGRAVQRIGATRDGDGRGRHTTTTRTLHRLACGACLIDTPGLRTLRLDGDDGQALGEVFADITTLAACCRFRDCRHEGEPGCAVREGAPPERLRNWHKLQREAARDTMSLVERRKRLGEWKSRARAARLRVEAKRG